MNIFANILEVERYAKITYYTVKFEKKDVTEFDDFIRNLSALKHIEDELEILIEWLGNIAENDGALERYFRHEGKAQAIPPKGKFITIEFSENIRLYCLRVCESIVILFNGGIKTADKAQNCPNVKPHFTMANKLASKINEFFVSRELIANCENNSLIGIEDIEIEL